MELVKINTGNKSAGSVQVDDDTVNFSFTRNAITGDDIATVDDEASQAQQVLAMSDVLAKAVTEWDTTVDGVVLPITPENLRKVSLTVLNQMLEVILSDANPQNESERNSSFG